MFALSYRWWDIHGGQATSSRKLLKPPTFSTRNSWEKWITMILTNTFAWPLLGGNEVITRCPGGTDCFILFLHSFVNLVGVDSFGNEGPKTSWFGEHGFGMTGYLSVCAKGLQKYIYSSSFSCVFVFLLIKLLYWWSKSKLIFL